MSWCELDLWTFFFLGGGQGGGGEIISIQLVSVDLCWFEICCYTLCYTMSIMSSIDTSSQNAYGIVWSFWRKLLRSFLGVFIPLTIREDSGKHAMPFWKIVHLNVSVPVMHVVAGVAESRWFRSLGSFQTYSKPWLYSDLGEKTCHLGIVVCPQQPMILWLWKLLLKLT